MAKVIGYVVKFYSEEDEDEEISEERYQELEEVLNNERFIKINGIPLNTSSIRRFEPIYEQDYTNKIVEIGGPVGIN